MDNPLANGANFANKLDGSMLGTGRANLTGTGTGTATLTGTGIFTGIGNNFGKIIGTGTNFGSSGLLLTVANRATKQNTNATWLIKQFKYLAFMRILYCYLRASLWEWFRLFDVDVQWLERLKLLHNE